MPARLVSKLSEKARLLAGRAGCRNSGHEKSRPMGG
jgi:hypothetical protein